MGVNDLTWQAGADGRTGRWRKKYKGKTYYFAGTSKSDRQGYKDAVAEWEQKRREIDDADAVWPLLLDYAAAIKEWGDVVAWCTANNQDAMLPGARAKLAELQSRAALKLPPPIGPWDRFQQQVQPQLPAVVEIDRAEVQKAVAAGFAPRAPISLPQTTVEERQQILSEAADVSGHVASAVWQDRLDTMNRKRTLTGEDLAGRIDAYLLKRRLDVELGNLAAGRYDFIRVQLVAFRDWMGGALSVKSITATTVSEYHAELSRAILGKKLSASYAKDRFNEFRAFVRWLWASELIPALPRNLDAANLRINKGHVEVETIEVETVNRLLAASSDRTKLYLLLMLNCAMTQKDIADLKQTEVDLVAGTITRKRSKTSDHENVPTVRYKLWPETLRLLKQERAEQGALVLVNADGGPLKVERITPEGKLLKIDNVRSAFRRVCDKLELQANLIDLKKTSATLIRGRKDFSGLEQLFLGHAPTSMADKHYTKAPQELLDDAVAWLGKQYQTTPEKPSKSRQGKW